MLNEERMEVARRSLVDMLGFTDLAGKTFLDIGSGSGLFSLAAMQLGAEVVSFNYDAESVECARELKRRYFPGDSRWRIERGSVLSREYIESLGRFDIVLFVGGLHHTGAMYRALDNGAVPVKVSGQPFISLYNDQGTWSRIWEWEKKTYNQFHVHCDSRCVAVYDRHGIEPPVGLSARPESFGLRQVLDRVFTKERAWHESLA